jgi:Fe-S cluster assembly scaffold protein SufB
MTYLFDDFKNIRTFPANTQVYRDGVLVPEFCDNSLGEDAPLHIIHIGHISGAQNWFIDMNDVKNVYLTARITIDDNAKIRIEINANHENQEFDGKLFIKNSGDLDLNIVANNNKSYTQIHCETKLFAMANSKNNMAGTANIPSDVIDADSDIGFSALCANNVAYLKMAPSQRISSVPKSATHSASIYHPTPAQVKYLEMAGLSDDQATDLLNKAFMDEII